MPENLISISDGSIIDLSISNTIDQSDISNNQINGFLIDTSESIVVSYATCSYNEQQGILMMNSNNNEMNQLTALLINLLNALTKINNLIKDNNASYNGIDGIYLNNSHFNEVSYNNASYNSRDGIRLDKSNHNQVYENTLYRNTQECITNLGIGNNIHNNYCNVEPSCGCRKNCRRIPGYPLIAIIAFSSLGLFIVLKKYKKRAKIVN